MVAGWILCSCKGSCHNDDRMDGDPAPCPWVLSPTHLCSRLTNERAAASTLNVYLAFAAVYIIWGSTYFAIREALTGFPPFLLGGVRFLLAALCMFAWCLVTGVRVNPGRDLWKSMWAGFLLLFVGNGVVIWAERTLPSSLVAILIAAAPLSFVLLDHRQWTVNFRSPATLLGVGFGLGGVLLLFWDRITAQFGASEVSPEVSAMLLLLLGIIGWPAGSLFAKYRPSSLPNTVNSAWQMATGALMFLAVSAARGEMADLSWSAVPARAWWALGYLVVFGSIIGYSAYIFLLGVRPATQVSTYAYVNPVVAVLLGLWLGDERLGAKEIAGLLVILGGVLLINLAKYRKAGATGQG